MPPVPESYAQYKKDHPKPIPKTFSRAAEDGKDVSSGGSIPLPAPILTKPSTQPSHYIVSVPQDTPVRPTRLVEPYWSSPTCTLYLGDCLKVMPQLPSNSVNLICTDPPFNVGWKYDQYEDWREAKNYLDWCEAWLKECRRLLHPTGTIWVASGIKYQAEIKCIMDRVGLHWRDTVVWHYSFGPRQESKFTPSWVALHYYTKDPGVWTWNKDAVKIPSARQLKYKDKRAVSSGKQPDNVWILLPEEDLRVGIPHQNLWMESRVCGTFKERTGHVCQMPLAILDRIVRVCSNPSDMVGDIMLGSATTLVAALQNGRSGVGIELSEDYLRDICVPRLKRSK